jgi:aarF domain-containing kinase
MVQWVYILYMIDPLLSAMLTLRAWDDIVSRDMSRLQNKGTKSESERIRFYAQRYMKQIVTLMETVPSALLLLLKTNDCLRQLDKSVGAPINTMAGKLSSQHNNTILRA